MASPHIDEIQLQALAAEGLSPTDIARQLGLPRSTVRDRLKKLHSPPPSEVTPYVPTEGIPQVYGEWLITMMNDLQELVTWWQERKATLLHTSDATQETERITFHVERRWIEAIRRQANLDGLTITQVVNAAFRQHFEDL
jgi:helix-turn-helix protein